MKVFLTEKEVKHAIERYVLQCHEVKISADQVQFLTKQDKAVVIGSAHAEVPERREPECLES